MLFVVPPPRNLAQERASAAHCTLGIGNRLCHECNEIAENAAYLR